MNKKQAQRVHAKRRARERYGLALNRHDLAAVVSQIRSGQAIFVRAQSNRVSIFDVKVGQVTARVVYDKLRGNIASFLPLEGADETKENVARA